jgi:hypothetical protein
MVDAATIPPLPPVRRFPEGQRRERARGCIAVPADAPPFDLERAHAVRDTKRAVYVEQREMGRRWVPRSHILPDSQVRKRGDRGTLRVTAWFAINAQWRNA